MSFDDAVAVGVQIVGALIVLLIFYVQFWRDRIVSVARWIGFSAWTVIVVVSVAVPATRDRLSTLFPFVWVSLLVAVLPDYWVEKIAGRRDMAALEARLEAADSQLMLSGHDILNNMRQAGRSLDAMQDVVNFMELKAESKDTLMQTQRMLMRANTVSGSGSRGGTRPRTPPPAR